MQKKSKEKLHMLEKNDLFSHLEIVHFFDFTVQNAKNKFCHTILQMLENAFFFCCILHCKSAKKTLRHSANAGQKAFLAFEIVGNIVVFCFLHCKMQRESFDHTILQMLEKKLLPRIWWTKILLFCILQCKMPKKNSFYHTMLQMLKKRLFFAFYTAKCKSEKKKKKHYAILQMQGKNFFSHLEIVGKWCFLHFTL